MILKYIKEIFLLIINMNIETPITKMFGLTKPIFLAGMNVAAGPELAAAVSNSGGLGVIGGLGYTPEHASYSM